MKLLFDQNLSFKLCRRLDDIFPGSSQVRLVGLAEADDRSLWDYAREHGFVLVSQDSDFAEMATLFGPPPKLIGCEAVIGRPEQLRACCAGTRKPLPPLGRIRTPPAWSFTDVRVAKQERRRLEQAPTDASLWPGSC